MSGADVQLACAPQGANTASRIRIGSGARTRASIGDSFVLVDQRVADLHPDCVRGHDPSRMLAVGGGEGAKSFALLERVLRTLAQRGVQRSDSLTVIGGGTVGDLGGLAAALHLRGVPFQQIPTTLLAMVDSSVGGKTAINLPEGKNLVGAFWAPHDVWIDPDFLATLDDADFHSGLGEVLKIALGLDAELFAHCERARDRILARDSNALATAIEHAVRAKVRIVESDYREGGSRKLLNLGHTLAHALEGVDPLGWPHGIAVARGLHFALELARAKGAIDGAAAARGQSLLAAYGFAPTELPNAADLAAFIRRDKKRTRDAIDFVLPTGIGSSIVDSIPTDDVLKAIS